VLAAACKGTTSPRPGQRNETGSSASGGGIGLIDDGGEGGEPSFGGQPAAASCGEPPETNGEFSKASLLRAAASCAAFQGCVFHNAAENLERNVAAFASEPSTDNLAKARAAYRATMDAWSIMEGFQFGPVADNTADEYHGRGLRTLVHPWPNTNRCNVETQIATREYDGADGFKYVPPSGRGLYAIEYVLFTDFPDTVCASNQPAAKAWQALDADQLSLAKRDYAAAVATDVLRLATEIVAIWAEDGEDFEKALLGHVGYGSEQETLNVVAWSLMYPEAEIKDWKLGPYSTIPTIPASVGPETPYALVGAHNVRANLLAFRALFSGCAGGKGLGFDDWLTATGATELRDDLLTAYAQAQAAADAFPSFQNASTEQFNAFYDDIKPLSDLLKGTFFGSGSPLSLKLPASAASDTD
jgi:predicted lipoprotein